MKLIEMLRQHRDTRSVFRLLFFTTIVFAGSQRGVRAQLLSQNDKPNYTPPSPNAAALLEYASVPVTLHTGTAEVSVPLGNIQSRKGSVPFSISYHASGIKVQDLSSSVGMGWVLNAGGVITRIVRGLPDEATKGYFNQDFNTTFNDIYNLQNNDVDGEPDIFFFNFMGFQGRMVMNPLQQIVPLPEQDFVIVPPNFSSADPKWQITDKNGIMYFFGTTSESREVSDVVRHTQYAPNPTQPNPNPHFHDDTYSAITSWYLKEIHYPYETDVITFSYTTGSQVYYENYSQSLNSLYQFYDGCDLGYLDPNTLDHINQITISQPKYVSMVTTTLGSATFSYASRDDIANALRLTGVQISNSNGAVKQYALKNSGYFVSDDCSTADCKRLRLDEIRETTGGTDVLYRKFNYSLVNLPSRKSVKYDHWGYYNNNTYPSAIPESRKYVPDPLDNLPSAPTPFDGADKTPVLERTAANILTQITNAGGGIQRLYYELNKYDDNGTTRDVGGVRISRITEDDGAGVNAIVEKIYQYKLISNPSLSSGVRYRNYYYDFLSNTAASCDGGQSAVATVMRSSISNIDLFDINGLHVGYSDVQVLYSNGGSEQFFFTSKKDHPDDPAVFDIPNGYNGNHVADFTSPDGPPFVPNSDRSFERGLLKRHIYFNNAGLKVKETVNDYEFYQVTSRQAKGVKAMILAVSGPAMWARRGVYTYMHRGVRLLRSSEKDYDKTDQQKRFSKTTSYTYSTKYTSVVKEATTLLNDGSAIKMQYMYPFDYPYPPPSSSLDPSVAAVVASLDRSHIIESPIETTAWLQAQSGSDFKVVESKLVTYKFSTVQQTVAVPYQVFKLTVMPPISDFTPGKDSRYKLVQTFDSYDNFGNLLQDTPKDGLVTNYSWGNNSSLLSGITKSAASGPQLTTFEYLPMIGLISITDPAGLRESFEYDLLGRLKIVRDHNSDIATRYRYHYGGQFEFGSAFTVSGLQRAGQPLIFSSLTNEIAGATTCSWDFGDGKSGSGSGLIHVYAAPGTYTITLTKTNSEYGISKTSLIKTIN